MVEIRLVVAALLLAGADSALLQPGGARAIARSGWSARAAAPPVCFETLAKTSGAHGAPSAAESASLAVARPQPALQPREVIATMLHALHRSNWDRPTPFAGFETALRFLSPSHQYRSYERSKQYTPQSYARYLRQPHKATLLAWDEYRWDGDVTLIQGEAYQQTSVRPGPNAPWTSVRWVLKRVNRAPERAAESAAGGAAGGAGAGSSAGGASQWMVDAVFTDEPDGGEDAGEPMTVAPLSREEQQSLFRGMDPSASGSISPQALVDVIASLGVPRAEAEGLARITDANSDGVIDFDEFAKLLNKVNQRWSAAGSFARLVTDGARLSRAYFRQIPPFPLPPTPSPPPPIIPHRATNPRQHPSTPDPSPTLQTQRSFAAPVQPFLTSPFPSQFRRTLLCRDDSFTKTPSTRPERSLTPSPHPLLYP
jgi:hypothetical protein